MTMIKQFTIGRGDDCQIRVQDQTQKVSRNHATLKITKNGKMFIIDHSTNGTWVNGVKISQSVDYPIKRGDTVSFGHAAELNWELVPRTANKLLLYILIVVLLFGIATGSYFVIDNQQNKEKEKREIEIKLKDDLKQKEVRGMAVKDSVRRADSIRISQKTIKKEQTEDKKKTEPEKKPQPVIEKKDTIKAPKKPIIY